MTDRELEQRSVADLRSLIRSAEATPGRNAAFYELIDRDPAGLGRTLRSFALDPDLDQPMRLHAVAELSRTATASSLGVLRELVAAEDEVVRQRAIERLGKIGTVGDLDTLRAVRSGNRRSQQVLRVAKCYLSYRHRLGDYRLDVPRRRFGAGGDETEPVRSGGLTTELRDGLQRALDVPGLDLVVDPAWRLECAESTYVLLLNQAVVGDGLRSLADRQAVVGVVVERGVETGRYGPAFYLMTDPAGRGRFHVFGTRGSGRIGLYGSGTVQDAAVTFELEATELPVLPPTTIEATYDLADNTVHFEHVATEPLFADGQQRHRRRPRRD